MKCLTQQQKDLFGWKRMEQTAEQTRLNTPSEFFTREIKQAVIRALRATKRSWSCQRKSWNPGIYGSHFLWAWQIESRLKWRSWSIMEVLALLCLQQGAKQGRLTRGLFCTENQPRIGKFFPEISMVALNLDSKFENRRKSMILVM